ncbi:MAG: T9SS type A sorting domain-containing protein [Bacteroidales bacterium]|nr:T9SS type A sorting domain-containing protein [Bacteroidales bacterium]MDY0217522.1 T9SS type A sorting domain-containing protein [Bacteroidales bacterium]
MNTKTIIKSINLSFFLILIPFMLISQTSKQSGNWSDNNSWDNKSPGDNIKNTTITILQGHTITFGEEGNQNNNLIIGDKVIFKIAGELVIHGDIISKILSNESTSNKIEFHIASNAIIRVNGNILVNNHLEIKVEKTGIFEVNGNIKMHNHGALLIDGILKADSLIGHMEKHNQISGDGVIYTNSISGVDTSKFKGKIYPKEESTLPIELISFDAQINNNAVAIQWATATEVNNDYFTIEKSNDMKNWDVIATQKGAGNSNQYISYQFIDNKPTEGISYYRLKQTDFDGQFEYFSPVVVKNEMSFTNEIEVNIYPNPSNGIFNIHINSEIEKGEIKITNNLGQIVANYPIANNQHFPIDIAQFGKGIYHVLILGNSSILQAHKVIIR